MPAMAKGTLRIAGLLQQLAGWTDSRSRRAVRRRARIGFRFPIPDDEECPPNHGEPRSEGPSFRWRDSICRVRHRAFARPDRLPSSWPVTVSVQALPNSSKLQSRPATPRPIRRRRTVDELLFAGVPSKSAAPEIDRSFGRERKIHLVERRVNREVFPKATGSTARTRPGASRASSR